MKILSTFFLFIFCLLTSEGWSKITVPPLVGDHMVLQRDSRLPIWGWASPGENITVLFRGKLYGTRSADDGKWTVILDKSTAGGPFALSITADGEVLNIKDVLVGEVWLCSGQSNMVYDFNQQRAKALYTDDIASSENSQIRQILVNRKTGSRPSAQFGSKGWQLASPSSLSAFSIAAYFFGRELWEKFHVPIGLINASWGGTRAEAWMSENALADFPQFNADIAKLKDSVAIAAKINERNSAILEWHKKNRTEDKGYADGTALWAQPDFDDAGWQKVTVPSFWDRIGESSTYGVVWFRKEIDVPQDLAGKDAKISLGSIDDEDETFINGIPIGGFANRTKQRVYNIPGKHLRAGKNILTIRIINWNGPAGFTGDVPMAIDLGNTKIALEGEWRYQLGRRTGAIPLVYNVQDHATSLYNGMISPIIPYTIKGIIWYQGENNATRAFEYRSLLPALIADWRSHWKLGDFPFIIQQLVNFRQPKADPSESDWAELREAQLLTAKRVTNSAIAVGIDIGEAGDIHPVDKKTIGHRLVLAAMHTAYHDRKNISSGPVFGSMQVKGDVAILKFTDCGSGLSAKGTNILTGFALAGEDKKFVWAKAKIIGDKVELTAKGISHPIAVRYAWADNPVGANLYNLEGLPASPFRTDDWPGLTWPKPVR